MGKNLIIFKISGRNINNIFPPSELFAFEADIEEVKDVKKFLQFLKRLKSEKKWKFNSQSLSERINFSTIRLNCYLVSRFSHCAEIMKSIVNFYDPKKNQC